LKITASLILSLEPIQLHTKKSITFCMPGQGGKLYNKKEKTIERSFVDAKECQGLR
jgi:hypothetical protein